MRPIVGSTEGCLRERIRTSGRRTPLAGLAYALTGICLQGHTRWVDTFAVLAEPTRRRIVDELRAAERSVAELVQALAVSQPTVSKHLKVLRDSGLVSRRTAAQQRICRVEVKPFQALDEWLAPYRRMWTRHLDALERRLDDLEER